MEKKLKYFPAGLFFLCFQTKYLSKCPDSTKAPLPWKISDCAPVLVLWRKNETQNSFESLASREHGGWKEPQENDHLLLKITPSSYYIEWKTFLEASCANNIHTGEKVFRSCYTFDGFFVSIVFTQSKKACNIFRSLWVFLRFLEKRRPSEYCLW